jgi:uncharacterized protein YbaR (Trm112 family)
MSDLEDELAEQMSPDEELPAEDEQAEEEEQAETPEPEPEPEPEALVDEEKLARLKKITTSFNTYTASVERNLEEDWLDTVACPLCYGTDHPAYLSKHGAGRVPEDVKEAVLMFLGFAREQDYEPDPQTQTCRTCAGKGKTLTGSHVAGRETHACPTCKGSGAEGLSVVPGSAGANGSSEEAFTLAAVMGEPATDADNWGEPRILPDGRENPNWGRQPQFKVPVEPWGVTAGLNAVSETPAGV